MRALTTNIIVGMLGITVGAAGYAKISNSGLPHDSDSTVSTSVQAAVADKPALSSTEVSDGLKEKAVDSNDTTGFIDSFADVNESIVQAPLVQAPSITDNTIPAPESLMLALDGIEFDALNVGNYSQDTVDQALEEMARWYESSANPVRELIDLLMSEVNDDTKSVLKHLVFMGEYEGLTESILNEMSSASETEHDGWETLIRAASIDSTEERETMLSVLPSLTNEALVSATLQSVQPAVIPTHERAQMLDAISPYANSIYEDVQSAAMVTLANFSGHDYSYIIEDALTSGTDQLKHSAIYAASIGGMQTDVMKNQISEIMQDETASFSLRTDAFDALRSFRLDEDEYNLYYEFYRNNIVPLEQEANRG